MILTIGVLQNSYAQGIPDSSTNRVVVTDTLEYAFLPALGYNSDFGLIGGGIMSRYYYKDGVRPFNSYLTVNALASTKGLFSASILYDKPQFYSSRQRLTTDLYVSKFLNDQFYGIGTYQDLDPSISEDQDFYYYESFSFGIESILRRSLNNESFGKISDLYLLAEFDYLNPVNVQSNTFIYEWSPVGFEHSGTVSLGTGYIFDSRNNEFDPRIGIYGKAGFQLIKDYTSSTDIFSLFESEFRTYQTFHLIRDITFANRISYQHLSGKAPFGKLPVIGGEKTMRGYPENRFIDDNALLLNTELRTWLFEFPMRMR
ncbi:MAG: BamA/TamA family outer membrane protein [Gracilimonas sp.]|nr:BamA/TamA family outer membrane protein [Gracilimonas sp.]